MFNRMSCSALVSLAIASLFAAIASCSRNQEKIHSDPIASMKDPTLAVGEQREALEQVWSQQLGGYAQARETLKTVAWRVGAVTELRIRAMELLLSDQQDKDNADTRAMFRLMLPPEPSPSVIEFISSAAGERGWKEFAPALIRSWSRSTQEYDDRRPERSALTKLFPGQSLEKTIYDVFAQPAAGEGIARQRAEAGRTAAWEVLTRLDPDGSRRLAMLQAAAAQSGDTTDPLISDLQACVRELRVMPITASQLEWLRQMRRFDAKDIQPDGPARKAWWAQATTVVSSLSAEQTKGLALRHIEPLRWAAANRPQWMRLDRATLLGTLKTRLAPRRDFPRSVISSGGMTSASESLADYEAGLVWADAITILAIDDLLSSSTLRAQLWEQVLRDIKDTTTELGGLIQTDSSGETAMIHPPRPTQRRGDDRYVAPEEMFLAGPIAMCHYHFHAQKINHASYAGPGPGDAEFAREQGRACILITPVGEKRFDVDYYHTGGVTIDLGEMKAP